MCLGTSRTRDTGAHATQRAEQYRRAVSGRRQGDAEVVLGLVVEKDGSVFSAKVLEGAEPFAEQARARALTWRFEPAKRGDVAVAARIRARVAFHRDEDDPVSASVTAPPAAPVAVASASGAASAAATPTPAPEPPLEITVQGARREIGQTTLSKSDVRQMPGAFGDAFGPSRPCRV